MPHRLPVLVLLLVFKAAAFGQQTPDLSQLYSSHQWFALRDAARAMSDPGDIVRGMVACAFNDLNGCERNMQGVIASGASAQEKAAAHVSLLNLYMDLGRSRSALPHYKAIKELVGAPGGANTADPVMSMLQAYASFPDMTVVSFRASTIPYYRQNGHVAVPVTINGKPGLYKLDTGAGYSAVRESEAKRVGMHILDISPLPGIGFTGAAAAINHVAIAENLELGRIRLRNVPFLVLPDASSSGLIEDRGGALGVQVLAALESIRLESSGHVQIGSRSSGVSSADESNLVFDGTSLRMQAELNGHKLDLKLDTGTGSGFLTDRFAQEFPGLVKESGRAGTWTSAGFGDPSANRPATFLLDLKLRVGTAICTIPNPAIVEVPGTWGHGVVGMDLFKDARVVTLDFRRMMLTVEEVSLTRTLP